MSVYSIVKVGDPLLREKAKQVEKITQNINKLITNMVDTMHEMDGVGLAAPQIGIPKRVIVVDVGDEGQVEVINPEIVSQSEETEIDAEGCLSVPGIRGEVERLARVKVKGLNQKGEEVLIEAEDLMARVLQHEIDHLEGILFIDKVKRFVE